MITDYLGTPSLSELGGACQAAIQYVLSNKKVVNFSIIDVINLIKFIERYCIINILDCTLIKQIIPLQPKLYKLMYLASTKLSEEAFNFIVKLLMFDPVQLC